MSVLNVNQIQPVGSSSTITFSENTDLKFGDSGTLVINQYGINSPTGIITATQIDGAKLTGISTVGVATVYASEVNAETLSGVSTISIGSSVYINGDLNFSNGNGIYFGAGIGTNTATSSLLDDYEEGTFTPSFTNVSTPTYSNQIGNYVKVGNLVNYTFVIEYSSLDTSDASAMAIQGLPFLSATTATGTVAGGGNVTGGNNVDFYNGSATTGVCISVNPNNNVVTLLGLGDSNTFDYSNCNATGRIRVTGCYISA